MARTVSDLSVADIRRSLGHLRTMWANHSPSTPMCITSELDIDMNVSEFCFHFLMNHHSKRSAGEKEAAASKEDEDDEALMDDAP